MKYRETTYRIVGLSFFIGLIGILLMALPRVARADTAMLSPYSWDPGLYATVSPHGDSAHAWGMRKTKGAWGTGPVNYQSGATLGVPVNSTGSMIVTVNGTYCPGGRCSYGSGSGYKGLVQFWNDPSNYIAFGLIHDPGVSPTGTTLMVEGAANGRPVGGYWGNNAITGANHTIRANWNGAAITFILDGKVELSYPVASTHPSISFLAAARENGDIADTTFTNINFDPGTLAGSSSITLPATAPYVTYDATIRNRGTGTGNSAYINTHDAHNNALAFGIQTDFGAPESNGVPYYVWEKVQNGVFTYGYIKPASHNYEKVTLKWWKNEKVAAMYANGEQIALIPLNMEPRLFFNAEGNARLNGDTVESEVNDVQIKVGDNCPRYCGLNGTWNTDFSFYGLRATNTNGLPQNGANFAIGGRVAGLPPGGDWDTHLVAGIGMIAQYWDGQ